MKKLICVLLAGVLAVAMFAGCERNSSDSVIEGNGEQVVSDGKYVYYIDDADRTYIGPIRRVSLDDGVGKSELVYDGMAACLNLSQDGKLYFLSGDGISWIKLGDSNSGKTDLVKGFRDWFELNGDWLYFLSRGFDGERPRGIYRTNVNTLKTEMFIDGKENAMGEFAFWFVGDVFYYIAYSEQEKDLGLMKKHVNGDESTFIMGVGLNNFYRDETNFYVTDKYIYCRTISDRTIKRVDFDGKNEEIIYTESGEKELSIMFADNDFVYLINKNSTDGFSDCYRIKADDPEHIEQIVKNSEEVGENNWNGYFTSTEFIAGKIFVRFNSYGDKYEGGTDGRTDGYYCMDRDGKNSYKLQ